MSFDPLDITLAGMHSIEASAGTGKTHTITTLYLRYLLETECRVEEILVTTFTEAATAELKERLRGRVARALELVRRCAGLAEANRQVELAKDEDTILVGALERAGAWRPEQTARVQKRLETALLDFDRAPVFTIHGFCNRILQEQVFESASGFQVELITSQQSLLDEAVADFVARWWTADDSLLPQLLPLDDAMWGLMRQIAAVAIDNPSFPIVPPFVELETLLKTRVLLDFETVAAKLQAEWLVNRKAALELLHVASDHDCLNQATHKPEQLQVAIRFIDLLVAAPSTRLFKPDSAGSVEPYQRRLGQNALVQATKKGRKDRTPKHRAFELIDEVIERLLAVWQQRDVVQAQLLAGLAHDVRQVVAQRKRQLALMSFSDLLHQVDTALQSPQGRQLKNSLRQRYRVAMVDEFQDTDPVQYRIFSTIFCAVADDTREQQRGFILVGDPKQSIYRFRGADIHSYLAATQHTAPENRHALNVNWRSDDSLVRSVQAIFRSSDNPFLNQSIGLPDVVANHDDRVADTPALEITFIPNRGTAKLTKDQALELVVKQVAADIIAQLNGSLLIQHKPEEKRQVTAGDLAVLCRTSAQLRLIHEALTRRGVPAVLQTEESVFDTSEAEATSHVLRALLTPGDLALQAGALATSLFGLTATDLDRIRQDEQLLSQWGQKFQLWHEQWFERGFIVAWRRLLEDEQVVPRLVGQITGERQVTNYLHLGELLHRRAMEAHNGPEQVLRWLEQMIDDQDSRDREISQLRLETDAQSVQLCTIHKCKGLEYPIVYCPTLWHVFEGNPPGYVVARLDAHQQRLENPEIDVGSVMLDERLDWNEQESRAEDRRLLYVALTRARHQCRIYWTGQSSSVKSGLGGIIFGDTNLKDESEEQLETRLRNWGLGLGVDRIVVRGRLELEALDDPGTYQSTAAHAEPLVSRCVTRTVIYPLAHTSFTALVHRAATDDELEPTDRDESWRVHSPISDTASDDELPTVRVALADVPRGAKMGDLIHQVFEDLLTDGAIYHQDYDAIRHDATQLLLPQLARVDLDPYWSSPLADSLAGCLTGRIRLGDRDCRLADIVPEDLACEVEFLLRVAGADRDAQLSRIGMALARSSRSVVREYAQQVERMGWSKFRGFLKGSIDLVFRSENRWYLMDYKSNRLGPHTTDFTLSRLEKTMSDSHYILQYHLYVAALDRLLRQRLPDYDYDRHFGGVAYLFVRGYDPARETDQGIYFDRPDREVVDTLQLVLDGEDL